MTANIKVKLEASFIFMFCCLMVISVAVMNLSPDEIHFIPSKVSLPKAV